MVSDHSVSEYSKYGAKYRYLGLFSNKKIENKNALFLLFFQNPDVKHVFIFTWPYMKKETFHHLLIQTGEKDIPKEVFKCEL